MTTVNVTDTSATVVVTETTGTSTVITAPAETIVVSTVGLGPQGPGGALGLYATIIDTTDQPLISTTTPQPLQVHTLVESRGITVVDNTKITFELSGTYKIAVSLQLTNSANNLAETNFFFTKNGAWIADSNTRIDLQPRKSQTVPYHDVFTIEFQVSVQKQDYISLLWIASILGVSVDTLPVSGSHPQTPGVIINVAQVMFSQAGVPIGGDPGSVLLKAGTANYDTEWAPTLDAGTFN